MLLLVALLTVLAGTPTPNDVISGGPVAPAPVTAPATP